MGVTPCLRLLCTRRSSSPKVANLGREALDAAPLNQIIERQLGKELYSAEDANLDFIEIVLMFSYVSMFTAVFPFTPLVVVLLLIVEVRVDGHRLFNTFRRPMPQGVGSIGAWSHMFQLITWVSVLTNTMLSVWSLRTFDSLFFSDTASEQTRWLMTMACVMVFSLFKLAITVGMPNMSRRLWVLTRHHKLVGEELDISNLSVMPREISVLDLDTRVH